MMKKFESLKNREWPSWAPIVVAALGALLYLIQAVIYAYTTVPGLDEGSYLLKGILYLRGVYEPFEPYGPLTNKAPFAFLIPGFVQYLFGAGLRTGRFFAIFLGLLTLLGVWITARRWGGKWSAAGAVWVFALSSMVIKTYSVAVSEVIIACLLAWMCVCVLGDDRPLWQIILGTLLATLAVLTRQNMAPVLALLILYIFWQHGKQKGIWAFVVGAVFFLAVHIYYWPNILAIWAPWLPENLTPFLDPFRMPKDAIPFWDPSISSWNRMNAFFQGIRYHFVIIVGSIFALTFWPRPRDWKSASGMRAAVFLALLYFILFSMHAWAAVASQYESYSCVYCFSNYLSFFDPLGIILLVIVFTGSERRASSRVMQAFVILLVLILSTGIGFSLFESIGRWVYEIPVPRMRDGQFLPGTTGLVDILTNRFGLTLTVIKRGISAGMGLLVGLAALLAAFLVWRRAKPDFAHVLINSFLVLGFVLAPIVNARGSRIECEQDLITANEQLGAYLANIIPSNSLVYWDGGLSFTPMIYVPQVRIFPPQINSGYTYRDGGDADTVYRLSHWNGELNEQWKNSADIFIIEVKRYSTWKDFLNPQEFEEYQKPSIAPSCLDGAGIRIFHRLP
ncbi:MAG TPA: glycosyltransferase family 39 protein [Anaerolineales bacterium]|mgnify:FL=1|nr:glycosyltransferase family 39 protein [Anaerolineales bacterium]